MHSRDRRWPVTFWLCAFMLAFFAGELVVFPVITADSPPELLAQVLAHVDWWSPETYLTILLILGIQAFVWFAARYIILARRREGLRARALAGEVSAMPVVNSPPDLSLEATTDTLRHQPLTLRLANGSVVTASAEGLRWQRRKKRDVLLRWNEARLLEQVDGRALLKEEQNDIFEYGYCLYANSRKFVEWTDLPESLKVGDRLSWEQKDQLQKELLAIVMAHTRLPLRAMLGELHAQQKKLERLLSGSLLHAVLFSLAIPVIPLGTAVLALVAPLTRSTALNLYTAITVGIAGLRLLMVPIREFLNAIRPPASRPLPVQLPPVPVLAHPNAPVAITSRSVAGHHLSKAVITALVVGNIYPLVRAFQDYSIFHSSPSDVPAHLRVLCVDGLILCVVAGILVLLVFVFDRRDVLLADEAGLHRGKGRKKQFIPWADVAVLTANKVPPDTLESFEVVEMPPQSGEIRWLADTRWVRPLEGTTPEQAGMQFAALVAERAGIQPTTKWE